MDNSYETIRKQVNKCINRRGGKIDASTVPGSTLILDLVINTSGYTGVRQTLYELEAIFNTKFFGFDGLKYTGDATIDRVVEIIRNKLTLKALEV